MNVFMCGGRLGADAELRATQSGDKVLGFRLANDVGFGDRKTTHWIECSLWGGRGEKLVDHLRKGAYVIVTGELTLREFEKRDGTRGSGLALRVSDLDLGPKQSAEGGGGERPRSDDRHGGGYGSQSRHNPSSTGGYTGGYSSPNDLDDEIPF